MFGGGRGHQGQDMFASCGTRLVAARGGRVEFAGHPSAAGNYVVIDGTETGIDYVYMHLLERPLLSTGQRGLHRPEDRRGGGDRSRHRTSPPLRVVVRARLVEGR
jgi:Peptidase family M23